MLYEGIPKYTSGGNRKVMWHCKCSCGNEIDVHSGQLISGRTQSCGCLNKDINRKRMQEMRFIRNTYNLSGDYGIGYTTKGEEFWFDLEDYDLIKNYCWYIHHSKYVMAHGENHKLIMLHKLIMNDLDNKYDIDHIKTEHKFDNRKSNLRRATRSQNNCNKIRQKNNKSGVPGVRFDNWYQKWIATINVNKKERKVYLGNNFEEAVMARKIAEQKYYKEYSYDNSQKIAQGVN